MRLRGLGLLVCGLWLVSSGCSSDTPCGPEENDLSCAEGELCVANSAWNTTTYACASNPCGDGPVDCSCAAAACEYECTATDGHNVSCICTAC